MLRATLAAAAATLPSLASAQLAPAPSHPSNVPAACTAAAGSPTGVSVIVCQGADTKPNEGGSVLKRMADVLQTFGLAAAGVFFAWKLASGYQAVNMSLSLQLRRQPLDATHDYLVIGLSLEKGDREASSIKRIALEVQPQPVDEVAPTGTLLAMQHEVVPRWDRYPAVAAEVEDIKARLFVTPGETARFEQVVKVKRNETLLVAAQVLADSGFFGRARVAKRWEAKWRTTAISTPADRTKEAEAKATDATTG